MDERELQQAVDELQAYLARYGKTPDYYAKQGHLLALIGEYQQAISVLQEAIALEPGHVDALLELGQCHMAQNQLGDALRYFAVAARTLSHMGHQAESQGLVRAALEIDQLSQGGAQFLLDVVNTPLRAFLVISDIPYSSNGISREVELARALAKLGHEVYYIQLPGQAAEQGADTLQAVLRSSCKVDGLTLYQPGSGERLFMELCLHLAGTRKDVAVLLFSQLAQNIVRYLCTQYTVAVDWSEPDAGSAEAAESRYCASLVFCASAGLCLDAAVLEQAPQVLYLPNAVEETLWNPQPRPEEPAQLALIPHPRIGYVGEIDERLDQALLSALARRHPEWSFVLVGPCAQMPPAALPANVYRLEHPMDADLACYLAYMDVGILPYRRDLDSVWLSDSTALYWYLAAQIPAVSGPLPDCLMDKRWVCCAGGAEDFSARIEAALSGSCARSAVEMSNDLTDHSWLARGARLARSLLDEAEAEQTVAYIQTCLTPGRGLDPAIDRLWALAGVQADYPRFVRSYTQQLAGKPAGFDEKVRNFIPQLEQMQAVQSAIQARKKDPDLRLVAIAGYFGAGNFGDELLLHTLLERIAARKDVLPVAICQDPQAVEKHHGIPALFFCQRAAVAQLVDACDAVILGPGGIIQAGICPAYGKNLLVYGQFYYFYPAKLARAQRKPVLCVGVGAEKLVSDGIGPLMGELFQASPLLWLRDENSKKNFYQMGLPNAEVYPDVSFLATETKKGAASAKGTRGRPTLGVNLRNFHLENLESVAAAVLSMYRQGWDIALICAEQFEDESLLTEFRRYMVRGLGGEAEGRVRLLPFASLQGTIDEISHVDIMMAMRLHVGLVAAQMGIPTLFLCYDDKVRAVAEQLGMEDYALTLSQCDEALLLKKLQALRENHAQISSVLQQRCQALRSQAMEGYHKLNDILAGLS